MSGIGRLRAAVALLALTCVLSPALAQGESDTTPPALVALSLPAEVLTSPTGADVTALATITDPSGVAVSNGCPSGPRLPTQIALRAPSNTVFTGAIFDSTGGDAYRATLHLPNYAQTGIWAVERVVLTDCAGNSRTLSAADLTAAGFPGSVTVGGVGDAAPPALTAFGIDPVAVDTNAGTAQVTVAATVTDDLAGVADGSADACGGSFQAARSQVTFRSPTANQFRGGVLRHRDGDVYEATFDVPRFSETGTWTIDHVHLVDCAQNAASLTKAQLDARGFPTSFVVTGVADTTPPVVAALSVTPQVVDTRASGADVTLEARLTDDLSGVSTSASPADCAGSFSHVTAQSATGGFAGALFEPTGADTYTATLGLPRFAEPGVWSLRLLLSDCAGNVRVLAQADLQALGLPDAFRVLPPLYEFGGFMNPLDPAVLAHRKAGSAMAVKFRLGGAQGLSIFDDGFPQVQPIDCATRQALGDAVPLSANEWRFMDLSDGVYHFKWKSSPDWHDVCRRLTLGFDDGSRFSADVHFS
jgi:hypothetical protein